MPTRRIFIAVDISNEARQRVVQHIDEMRQLTKAVRVRWERPEKLHITLKFLGDVNDRQLAHVRDIVGSIAKTEEPLTAELAGTGVFPNEQRAHVLWIGMRRGGDKVIEIARQVESMCGQFGFAEDDRAFSPHLTIARLKDRRHSRELIVQHLEANFEPVAFEVREFKIYESKLLPSGSIYTVDSTHKLENG